ncbi:hypothetical protein CBL_02075 [Carabus blaptoides fortunei]
MGCNACSVLEPCKPGHRTPNDLVSLSRPPAPSHLSPPLARLLQAMCDVTLMSDVIASQWIRIVVIGIISLTIYFRHEVFAYSYMAWAMALAFWRRVLGEPQEILVGGLVKWGP